MARVDIPTGQLTIARDDDKVIVARKTPIVSGDMRQAKTGSITDIVAVPHQVWTSCNSSYLAPSTVLDSAPGTAPAMLILIVGFVGALITTLALSRATSAWVGVPVGVVLVVAVAAATLYQQNRAEREWRRLHVALYHARDREALHRGRAAVRQIVEAWPHLGGLADVADPTPTLATALWELAAVLELRQTVRATRDDLTDATIGLPPGSQVWQEVAARRERAEAELGDLDRETGRHLAYLTGLADECGRFVREQEALAAARTAVARADSVLGRTAPVILADSGGAELAERTRAVLVAYRELTDHLGVADI